MGAMSAETSCGSPADLSVMTCPSGATSRIRPSDGSTSSLNTSRIRVGGVVNVDFAAGSDESSVACMSAGGVAAARPTGTISARQRRIVRSKDASVGMRNCGARTWGQIPKVSDPFVIGARLSSRASA